MLREDLIDEKFRNGFIKQLEESGTFFTSLFNINLIKF